MKVFVSIILFTLSALMLSSCYHASDSQRSMTIGMDEDYKIKAYYDGAGWIGMSKSMFTFEDLDGTKKLTFLADKGYYSLMSTQHYSIWISGTVRPLDTNWDYFSWDLKVLSKIPFSLVLSGFVNTNGYRTNEDGMVFDCMAGKSSIVLTNKLVLVYDRETNRWQK